jgi:hypothetical protein
MKPKSSAFMAVDDIKLVEGTCDSYLEPTTTPAPDPFQMWNCDFEAADERLCSWKQLDEFDDFDWTVGSGSTPTDFTGPDYDHTTEQGIQ